MMKTTNITKRVGINAAKKANEDKIKRKKFCVNIVVNFWKIFLRPGIVISFVGIIIFFAYEISVEKMKYNGFLLLSKFEIDGVDRLNREDILDAIPYEMGTALSSINDSLVAAELEQLDWVRHAVVITGMVNTMKIKVKEAKPLAYRFNENKWEVLSDKGEVLSGRPVRLSKLPIVNANSENVYKKIVRVLDLVYNKNLFFFGEISQVIEIDENQLEIFLSNKDYKLLVDCNRFTTDTITNYKLLVSSYPEKLKEAKLIDLRYSGFAYVR